MVACPKCSTDVKGDVCPNCQTPIPRTTTAKEEMKNLSPFEVLKGLTEQEVAIFNQYLKLIQGGWLEVAALDRLSMENKLELPDIKTIIKKGLKALQLAQEQAQKEAEQKAKQNAKQVAKLAKKQQKQKNKPPRSAVTTNSKKIAIALVIAIAAIFIIYNIKAEKPVPEITAAPKEANPAEKITYFLRQGRVACYSQEDLALITQAAKDKIIYGQMLNSGRCLVSRNNILLQDVVKLDASTIQAIYSENQRHIFLHSASLLGEKVTLP